MTSSLTQRIWNVWDSLTSGWNNDKSKGARIVEGGWVEANKWFEMAAVVQCTTEPLLMGSVTSFVLTLSWVIWQGHSCQLKINKSIIFLENLEDINSVGNGASFSVYRSPLYRYIYKSYVRKWTINSWWWGLNTILRTFLVFLLVPFLGFSTTNKFKTHIIY